MQQFQSANGLGLYDWTNEWLTSYQPFIFIRGCSRRRHVAAKGTGVHPIPKLSFWLQFAPPPPHGGKGMDLFWSKETIILFTALPCPAPDVLFLVKFSYPAFIFGFESWKVADVTLTFTGGLNEFYDKMFNTMLGLSMLVILDISARCSVARRPPLRYTKHYQRHSISCTRQYQWIGWVMVFLVARCTQRT